MQNIKLALQKSGRLSEKSLALLAEAGISINLGTRRLRAAASNYPLEILFLRDDDIPQYVQEGIADLGMVGENEVLEKAAEVDLIERLGFARCKLALALPRGTVYDGLQSFQGKKVATSYQRILRRFFEEQGIEAQIEPISGSVEIAPSIGLADAVFDIVSSGSTLAMNGLEAVETVLQSEAVMIASTKRSSALQAAIDQLMFRIRAVQRSRHHKYILLNAPNAALSAIAELLPGMKSPTVMPLAQAGWSSVHTVIQEDDFWAHIDQLKQLGAEGILVSPIEKMIL